MIKRMSMLNLLWDQKYIQRLHVLQKTYRNKNTYVVVSFYYSVLSCFRCCCYYSVCHVGLNTRGSVLKITQHSYRPGHSSCMSCRSSIMDQDVRESICRIDVPVAQLQFQWLTKRANLSDTSGRPTISWNGMLRIRIGVFRIGDHCEGYFSMFWYDTRRMHWNALIY